jgi:hypothetical protein
MIEDYDIVIECLNKYLDSMPPRSRVMLIDLTISVKEMMAIYSPPDFALSEKMLATVALDIVQSRSDLVIMNDSVIYKHNDKYIYR